MARDQKIRKEVRKAPEKTLKEKRLAKKEKHAGR
jgi:hypothetical protein